MSNINQPGNYRGLVIDRGIGQSSGGCEQLTVTMQAVEQYDAANGVWVPYQYEECEAQAYLNLITKGEQPNEINWRQIMRAFGWDGASFAALNNPDSGLAKQIQWQMGMETYGGNERCKVQGIGAYDATPGRQVEKLDAAAIRSLDAKYAAALKKFGGGPKPKTARPETPEADPTTTAGTPTTANMPQPPTPAPSPEKSKRGRPAKPATPSVPPAPTTTPSATPLSQTDAWNTYTAKAEGKTDLEIQNTWITVVKEVYGGDEQVGGDWSPVVAECCKRLNC